MKNKKAIYVLLPVVALIWGLIFYRIYSGVNQDEKLWVPQNQFVTQDLVVKADTFSLLADYKDPFLNKANAAFSEATTGLPLMNTSEKALETREIKSVLSASWPQIQYSGVIKNQQSNKQLQLITINGTGYLMQQGDKFLGLSLIKVYKDSVEVSFENERKIIKK